MGDPVTSTYAAIAIGTALYGVYEQTKEAKKQGKRADALMKQQDEAQRAQETELKNRRINENKTAQQTVLRRRLQAGTPRLPSSSATRSSTALGVSGGYTRKTVLGA